MVRLLVVSLLILGVGRSPMPRAEYHVIAHQEGTGHVCSLHEHLLRLHPVAGLDHGQHAAFHWHWALPRPVDPQGPNGPGDDSEDSQVPPTGADLLVEEGPSLVHPIRDGLTSAGSGPALIHGSPMLASHPSGLAHGSARLGGDAFSGTLARGPSLAAWLQRWTC